MIAPRLIGNREARSNERDSGARAAYNSYRGVHTMRYAKFALLILVTA
jgi:hypothetical protein